MQFEYAKGILKQGQTQKVNVTLTDEIPPELIAKMEKMGIDTKKLHIKTDEGKTIPIALATQKKRADVNKDPVKNLVG